MVDLEFWESEGVGGPTRTFESVQTAFDYGLPAGYVKAKPSDDTFPRYVIRDANGNAIAAYIKYSG